MPDKSSTTVVLLSSSEVAPTPSSSMPYFDHSDFFTGVYTTTESVDVTIDGGSDTSSDSDDEDNKTNNSNDPMSNQATANAGKNCLLFTIWCTFLLCASVAFPLPNIQSICFLYLRRYLII